MHLSLADSGDEKFGFGKVPKVPETLRNIQRCCVSWRRFEDDSGSYAVFTEQGSSASHTTAAKVLDVICGLPGCAGQASEAVPLNRWISVATLSKSWIVRDKGCPHDPLSLQKKWRLMLADDFHVVFPC